MKKQDYATRVKQHLIDYKVKHLGIEENGSWRGNPYPHILPLGRKHLNILEPIRESCWTLLTNSQIKLHSDFAHLNSSQALCFNLFFPFELCSARFSLLLQQLGLPEGSNVTEIAFEKLFGNETWHNRLEEGTSFDCYMRLTSGRSLFFEIKFTEQDFGAAKVDAKHLGKLEKIYGTRLKSMVKTDCLNPKTFCKHYQVLRNICYLDPSIDNQLFFIFPQANDRLGGLKGHLDDMVLPSIRQKIHVVHMEDLVNGILQKSTDVFLSRHFKLFREKYCVA